MTLPETGVYLSTLADYLDESSRYELRDGVAVSMVRLYECEAHAIAFHLRECAKRILKEKQHGLDICIRNGSGAL